MEKLAINVTKQRKATPNEIAKALFVSYLDNPFYNDHCNDEVAKHCEKHYWAIKKKLNLTDIIHLDVGSECKSIKEHCTEWEKLSKKHQ